MYENVDLKEGMFKQCELWCKGENINLLITMKDSSLNQSFKFKATYNTGSVLYLFLPMFLCIYQFSIFGITPFLFSCKLLSQKYKILRKSVQLWICLDVHMGKYSPLFNVTRNSFRADELADVKGIYLSSQFSVENVLERLT